jgi:hypothetical protein
VIEVWRDALREGGFKAIAARRGRGRLNHQALVTDIKLLGEVQRLGGGAGGVRVSGTAGNHWPVEGVR